jgi:outer membrane protein insertion porin family
MRLKNGLRATLLLGGGLFLMVAPGTGALAQSVEVASSDSIRGIVVEGNERIESTAVLSYLTVAPGDRFDPAALDTSLKVLFATGLFRDAGFERRGSTLVVRVSENPIINRVVFEGNRALKEDKIREEIEAQPRAIFTRARVQSDVQRVIELYRRSGRFAAQVTPKIVEQPQNRVDLIFEISEGPVTGVRRINVLGNRAFSDRRLRSELVTQESRLWRFFSSNDNYDPDRLEVDRERLRRFYTDRGYADFRVASAIAELTPDQEAFFVTFVIEEGQQYRFGKISVETELDILSQEALRALVPIEDGAVYQASKLDDTEEALSFAAGAAGYAFVDVRPRLSFNREERTIDVTFELQEGPRVYIERVDIVGNTRTLDNVIRRELQFVEGDAFNRVLINRSKNRVRALGFFEEVEITEQPGTKDDRAFVQVQVKEQPTGELSFGAGFSSVDAFLFDVSVTERNLRGRGQFLRLKASISSRRRIVDIRFTEPRFMGRNVSAGFELFNLRQDFLDEASFETATYGGGVSMGFPVSDNASLGVRYTIRSDEVRTFSGANAAIEASAGTRITSLAGYTLRWDRRNDPFRPTRGFDVTFSQDFAGIGGDVRYVRSEAEGGVYYGLFPDVIASFTGTTGYINEWGGDEVVINDRFFKGGSTFRGFEVAGLGPRIVEFDSETGDVLRSADALGGQFYAIGTTELSFPTGLPEQYGIKGSLFADFGTLGVIDDDLTVSAGQIEDELSLRASAGVSIFWKSPFGPIRFDFSEVLLSEEYDKTETFRFSTSTRF